VNREELLTFLRTWLLKFRGTLWFRITYLVLLGIIVAQLYLFTASAIACLIILLIPVLVFVIPYWLGERKIRRFAGNGALVFTIAILVAAAMPTQAILAQSEAVPLRSFPDFRSAPGLNLTNGTVQPYRGVPGQTFTFRVNLTTAGNGTPDAFNVTLNLTAVDGFAFTPTSYPMAYSPGPISSQNTRNGTWYERNVTLGGSIYIYGFSVSDQGRNWTETVSDAGPIIASGWSFYAFFLYYLVAVQGGFPAELVLYLGIIFLWWYMTRARERVMRAGRPAAKPETPPTKPERKEATEGTKAAKAPAFTCTNCGADVSASDQKCPSCGAAFED
jgi:hypothetical protein